jgi:hypothetical protein
MLRPSRLIVAAALVLVGACSAATPTAPQPPRTLTPGDFGPSMDGEGDDCRSGWSNPNGKTC